MKKITLLFVSISLLCSCSKEDAVVQNTNPVATEASKLAYFNAKLGSVTFDYAIKPIGEEQTAYTNADSRNVGFGADKVYSYSSYIRPQVVGITVPSLEINLKHINKAENDNIQSDQFFDAMSAKPVNFITIAQDLVKTKGVSLTYISENNTVYTTLRGDQSSSQINYTSSVNGVNYFQDKTQTVTGTVNCKLYNAANLSDVIELTNGKFRLTFVEQD